MEITVHITVRRNGVVEHLALTGTDAELEPQVTAFETAGELVSIDRWSM